MTTRKFVFAYALDEGQVRATRSLADWVSLLEDTAGGTFTGADLNDPAQGWDAVFLAIVWEYVLTGDYAEFVSEDDSPFND